VKVRDFGGMQGDVYVHKWTGVQLTLPAGWSLVSQGWGDHGGQIVLLKDSVTGTIASVWLKPETAQVADIPALLERKLDTKGMQRNSYQDYRMRAGSVQHITVGGNQGVSVLADFVNLGQQKSEYMAWIYSGKTHVFFDGRVPAEQLAAFQSRLDPLIQSASVP
jgi:hypothetical protein